MTPESELVGAARRALNTLEYKERLALQDTQVYDRAAVMAKHYASAKQQVSASGLTDLLDEGLVEALGLRCSDDDVYRPSTSNTLLSSRSARPMSVVAQRKNSCDSLVASPRSAATPTRLSVEVSPKFPPSSLSTPGGLSYQAGSPLSPSCPASCPATPQDKKGRRTIAELFGMSSTYQSIRRHLGEEDEEDNAEEDLKKLAHKRISFLDRGRRQDDKVIEMREQLFRSLKAPVKRSKSEVLSGTGRRRADWSVSGSVKHRILPSATSHLLAAVKADQEGRMDVTTNEEHAMLRRTKLLYDSIIRKSSADFGTRKGLGGEDSLSSFAFGFSKRF